MKTAFLLVVISCLTYASKTGSKDSKTELIGEGDHDLQLHGIILGGDDHDKKSHKKNLKLDLIGKDKHDYKKHKKALFGSGDHDKKSHGKLLGGGDHDMKHHGKIKILGRGDHDMKSHGKQKLLGVGDHDLKQHGKVKLLGSGNHDMKSHGKVKLLGRDNHDMKSHRKAKLLGSGDHDMKKHEKTKKLLGVDGHDNKNHGRTTNEPRLIGGSHDYFYKKKSSSKKLLGRGKHDYYNHDKRSKKFEQLTTFNYFMDKHNRTYPSKEEHKKRFSIFRENLKKARFFQQNEKGTGTYGVTKFSDLTRKEYRQMLGFRPHTKPSVTEMQKAEIPHFTVPTDFDWRTEGVVTPVKNQGMCGSCWAFSTTGNVEGQWAIKHSKLYSLSEQELVDCDSSDHGCEGGLPENAYQVINDLGGLETETAYPYEGKDNQCHMDKSKIKVTVNGSVELPQSETDIAAWLVKNGPVSIGINANPLQFYTGGVSHPLRFLCKPDSLDHGMLIVGFGVHTTKYLHRVQPYWLVKNSWGPDWGEQGYYRVYRGDGTCGVNLMVTSAIVP